MAIECELRIPIVRQRFESPYHTKDGESAVSARHCGREVLIVELKAVDSLAPIHTAKVISYLKTTGLCLGLLINFNVPLLKDGISVILK